MLSRIRIVSIFLALAASAGCAARPDAFKPAPLAGATLEGAWEGQVWETPVHYLQGSRPVTLKIARDGSWTATSKGTQCASGTASVRGGVVVLGGTRTGPDYCMPYSLSAKDGRMKAVFETSFKERETTAMIGLARSPERPPEAAQAAR